MARFKLTIEYDGTKYSGWQVQKGVLTIQGEFFTACKKIFETPTFEFYGAGRTDAGVHASGQVAHLDVETKLTPIKIKEKLNDILPSDINVLNVQQAKKDFNARRSAVARCYVYQISKRRTAFGKKYVWWVKDKLNVEFMRKAAENFLGLHNYMSFGSQSPDNDVTKAEIINITINETTDLIVIKITGSHFLWKQVRRMVGVLVEIGKGNMKAADIKIFLNQKSDVPPKHTAPPSGLFLHKIIYEKDEIFDDTLPDFAKI